MGTKESTASSYNTLKQLQLKTGFSPLDPLGPQIETVECFPDSSLLNDDSTLLKSLLNPPVTTYLCCWY